MGGVGECAERAAQNRFRDSFERQATLGDSPSAGGASWVMKRRAAVVLCDGVRWLSSLRKSRWFWICGVRGEGRFPQVEAHAKRPVKRGWGAGRAADRAGCSLISLFFFRFLFYYIYK